MSTGAPADRVHARPRRPVAPRHRAVVTTTGAAASGRRSNWRQRRVRDGFAATLLLAIVVLTVTSMGAWELTGGRIYVMSTASMCPSVCVGSAVVDEPMSGPLRPGELISFHPPAAPQITYTHAVWKVLPNGDVETKGTADQRPDPWLLTRNLIVGRVVFTLWGAGWALKALPLLAVGVACWLIGRSWIRAVSRRIWDRACMTLMFVLPTLVLHPWVSGLVITNALPTGRPQWSQASIVNTGLLPVAFESSGGRVVAHVAPGKQAVISAPGQGNLRIHEVLSLYWWGWVLVGLVLISPIAGYVLHLLKGDEILSDDAIPAHRAAARRELVPKPKHLGTGRARKSDVWGGKAA
jgi:hypothetical protein